MNNKINQNNNNLIQSNKSNQAKSLSIHSIGFAHILITTILIFYIMIPIIGSLGIKDQGLDLFNEKYNIEFYKTSIITFFINYVYLKIAELLPSQIPIFYKRIGVILFFSVLLNYYINNTPYEVGTIKFMKQWIKSVGWFGIIWDLFLISSIGITADKINNFNLHKMTLFNLLIFIIFTLFLLHV